MQAPEYELPRILLLRRSVNRLSQQIRGNPAPISIGPFGGCPAESKSRFPFLQIGAAVVLPWSTGRLRIRSITLVLLPTKRANLLVLPKPKKGKPRLRK
jgi:hypothetical protein